MFANCESPRPTFNFLAPVHFSFAERRPPPQYLLNHMSSSRRKTLNVALLIAMVSAVLGANAAGPINEGALRVFAVARHAPSTPGAFVPSTAVPPQLSHDGATLLPNSGPLGAAALGSWLRGHLRPATNRSDWRLSTTAVASGPVAVQTAYGAALSFESSDKPAPPLARPPFVSRPRDPAVSVYTYPNAWPSTALQRGLPDASLTLASLVLHRRLSPAQWAAVAEATNQSEAFCNDPATTASCALLAYEYLEMFEAQRRVPEALASAAVREILREARTTRSWSSLGWLPGLSPSTPYALPLLQRILIELTNTTTTRRATLAVGTDDTVFGLLVAMGAVSPTESPTALLAPPFGSAVVLSLLRNGTLAIGYGVADISNATVQYSSQTIEFTCETRQGQKYRAAQCPLGDWIRYVQNLGDGGANPWCRADPDAVDATFCAPWEGATIANAGDSAWSGAEAVSNCIAYRRGCPADACDGAVLHGADGTPGNIFTGHFALNRDTWGCVASFSATPRDDHASLPAWVQHAAFAFATFVFAFAMATGLLAADPERPPSALPTFTYGHTQVRPIA
jgi:hypothetical protein